MPKGQTNLTSFDHAMRAWDRAQVDAESVESGIDAIGRILRAEAGFRSVEPHAQVLVAAAALVPLYVEFGTDPDGEASQRLYEAAAAVGYKALAE